MSAATNRFEQLQRKFSGQLPSRKLSAIQRHHILRAASLWQISEVVTAEMVSGVGHDRGLVDGLQDYARRHLAAAGISKKPNLSMRTR